MRFLILGRHRTFGSLFEIMKIWHIFNAVRAWRFLKILKIKKIWKFVETFEIRYFFFKISDI